MKCARCKLLVQAEFGKLEINDFVINGGKVEINEALTPEKFERLGLALHELQMEFSDDRNSILIDKIKHAITEISYQAGDSLKTNFSDQIRERLGYTYKYLNNKFSVVMDTSIKRYFLKLQIEHVKEILIYEDLSISQVAEKLNYSNVSHLSSQFKKETGLTPTKFRQLNRNQEKSVAKQ